MAATVGTIILSAWSGETIVKDLYLSDTVNTPVNWDGGAGASATSPLDWIPDKISAIRDIIVVTGAAQTKLQLCKNGRPSGDLFRHNLHLITLVNRPPLNIPVFPGQRITLLQLA